MSSHPTRASEPGALIGEYEIEPVRGLPELLPEGEQILWQGTPDGWGIARRVFHLRKLAVYFGVLWLWNVWVSISGGLSWLDAIAATNMITLAAGTALAIVAALAWMTARATIYTVTNRRIIIRCGVVITLAINVPFETIQSVDYRPFRDGTGDFPLSVTGVEGIGYWLLWPHVRPWHFGARCEPMLRSVPEAAEVGQIISDALATPRSRRAASAAVLDEPELPTGVPTASVAI